MAILFAILAFFGTAMNQSAAVGSNAGKVSMQDFHFTQTANKVSMQDISITKTVDKSSPK